MIEKILSTIAAEYPLETKDVGEFATFKAKGMKFRCQAYQAKGFGHISVMTAVGFFGLMKMDTFILCPENKDLPLLSYDRIFAAGNDTLIIELYDTTLEKKEYAEVDKVIERYTHLSDRVLPDEENWYDYIRLPQSVSKKGKKKQTEAYNQMLINYVTAYLKTPCKVCEKQEKLVKTAEYAEGLLANGGIATDVFKKELGEEKTANLLRKVLFGIR